MPAAESELPGDLAANYAQAFAGHLTFGQHPALLIVDFVMAYMEPSSPLYAGVDAALSASVILRTAAQAAGVPVVFTHVEYAPGGGNGGLFYQKVPALRVFDTGSPLGGFPPALTPAADDQVIAKQYPSAFFGTCLADLLRGQAIDTLLICGLTTSGCVRASALDALQHGFAPFVVADACGDRHDAPHAANLFDLQAKYAEVIGLDAALALLAAHSR
jgi:maleamate amidohydrolase